MRSVEESLARLGLDRVDVVHVHDPDENFSVAVSEAYRALGDLRARGTIGAVSIGVNHAPVAARYLTEVADPGLDCLLLAGRYNLLDQSGLDDVLPVCAARGIAVMVAGVYQSGLLADPRGPHGYATVPPELAGRVAAWHEVCHRFGVPPTAAAVQFPFGHPAVTCVVVGARSPNEVDETARMLAHPVPDGFWAAARAAGLLPARVPAPAR
jgi:D-threo-aldose 1-dehydrogenase